MASAAAMALLKADLGRTGAIPDDVVMLMEQKLDAATPALLERGIAIDESNPLDMDLLVMYAAWLYRKRDTGAELPMMIRQAINNAQVSRATKEEQT